jgi:hypothetical protein
VGTEADDTYVVTDGQIFGGGLSITFSNIEKLEVTGEAGNDVIQILSTSPNVATSVYGALGSDTFIVTPRSVDPVISRNTKGHTGVLEHSISSGDAEYDGLLIEGVAVNVMDNDDLGYIHVVETSPSYFLTEDDDLSFEFYLFPTIRPTAPVVVDVNSQLTLNGQPYVQLGNSAGKGTLRLTWVAGEMAPKVVSVRHWHGAQALNVTDYNGLISIDLVATETKDPAFNATAFNATKQAIQPIYNKLIPRKNGTSGAKSVTIIEPAGETVVVEGQASGYGSSTYDIYLRPCTPDMKKGTVVSVNETVSGQVTVSPSVIEGDGWGDNCKVTVSVTAVDDDIAEGLHFVTLAHIVSNASGGNILLSDGSVLTASNVLVAIHDNDIGGVIIEDSNGATSVVETNNEDKAMLDPTASGIYFEDSYRIRLAKAPTDTVEVTVYGVATASDDVNQLGGLVSNAEIALRTTKRIQAHTRASKGGVASENTTLTFTKTNWSEWQTVYVSAVDDDITEGK